jgi:uncharacterized Zn finger protein (UPF0148 family)
MKRKRQKTRRVDKPCAICKHYMFQVHPNTQNCPSCAKANVREQNRAAVAKYREKEPKTVFKSEKRLSYERWREAEKEKKSAEQIDNNMPKTDFTGIPVPTKFDNLFCSIK